MSIERGFRPRALGEIAIRCHDYEAMLRFYGEVLGLRRLEPGERGGHRDGIAFFHLGESHGGHIAVLALFRADAGGVGVPDAQDMPEAGARSSLHHLALSLPWNEQDAARTWLEANGHETSTAAFDWTGWRGLFLHDPDGNTVELVAADPAWHLDPDSR